MLDVELLKKIKAAIKSLELPGVATGIQGESGREYLFAEVSDADKFFGSDWQAAIAIGILRKFTLYPLQDALLKLGIETKFYVKQASLRQPLRLQQWEDASEVGSDEDPAYNPRRFLRIVKLNEEKLDFDRLENNLKTCYQTSLQCLVEECEEAFPLMKLLRAFYEINSSISFTVEEGVIDLTMNSTEWNVLKSILKEAKIDAIIEYQDRKQLQVSKEHQLIKFDDALLIREVKRKISNEEKIFKEAQEYKNILKKYLEGQLKRIDNMRSKSKEDEDKRRDLNKILVDLDTKNSKTELSATHTSIDKIVSRHKRTKGVLGLYNRVTGRETKGKKALRDAFSENYVRGIQK